MQGKKKLLARSWEPGWRCFDLATDPYEEKDLGPAACSHLVEAAQRTFGRLPGQGVQRRGD
jgi:hypothetical protein